MDIDTSKRSFPVNAVLLVRVSFQLGKYLNLNQIITPLLIIPIKQKLNKNPYPLFIKRNK